MIKKLGKKALLNPDFQKENQKYNLISLLLLIQSQRSNLGPPKGD